MTEQRYPDPSSVPVNLGVAGTIERVLVVLPGYTADTTSRQIGEGSLIYRGFGCLWRLLTKASYRGFVRGYRDFYANARSADYMAARFSTLMDGTLADTAILLVTVDINAMPAALTDRQGKIDLVTVSGHAQLGTALSAILSTEKSFDAALLMHHDALGLGLHSIEKALLARLPDRTFVMNGRRRVYRLDRDMQRRLALRRFLAETRLAELVMSAAVRVLPRFSGHGIATDENHR